VRHVFPDTPSGGRVEARAALVRAGARGARSRTLRGLQHFFPRTRAAVDAVLETLVSEGDAVEPTEGVFRLTDQGLDKARHHPNPQFLAQR
jgi:hypothetical protein